MRRCPRGVANAGTNTDCGSYGCRIGSVGNTPRGIALCLTALEKNNRHLQMTLLMMVIFGGECTVGVGTFVCMLRLGG